MIGERQRVSQGERTYERVRFWVAQTFRRAIGLPFSTGFDH